jgi:lauroyl/myristoyl acyltransferase
MRLLGPFYVTGIFWYSAIHWVLRVPEPILRANVAFWSAFFFCTLVRHRRAVARNLEGPLGPCGFWTRQRRIWRTFHQHAWALVERFERLRVPPRPIQVEDAGADWAALAASSAGLIVASAHLSSWEAAILLPLATGDRRMHVVREAEDSAATHNAVAAELARLGDHVVTHFLGQDPQLGATLLAALRRGDVVTLSGDRPRAGARALRAPMFGREVLLPDGTFRLARAAGVPILPVFLFRLGRRRYRCVARPMIRVDDLATAAAAFARELEWAIRQAPHQWSRWEVVWCQTPVAPS